MIGQGQSITFAELADHPKWQTAYNGYCSIDGIALTQIGNSDEHFIDSKGKTTDNLRADRSDGRTEANKARTGQRLERNGKYIRSAEVRRTVISWVAAIGGISKVRFITITFPQSTPDTVGKKCLNIWLTRLRKAIPEISYLWTAERQQNGTIHFHLVTNRHLEIEMANRWMRVSLVKYADQIDGWDTLKNEKYNGVDVGKRMYSKLGIEKYLAKYLTKAQKSGINQPWHRSREMGELATKVRFSMERVRGIMNYAYTCAGQGDQYLKIFESDYCLYISAPPVVSELIKYHLDKYNRSRWRGTNLRRKYRSHVQDVEQSEVNLSLQTPRAENTEQLKLDLGNLPFSNRLTGRWSKQRIE